MLKVSTLTILQGKEKKSMHDMRGAPDLGRSIAYCSRLGMVYIDKRLRLSGYDVTPVKLPPTSRASC